jgi:acetyl esterase/lipase
MGAPAARDAPLRYRDTVFSSYTLTSDLVYGSAPDLTGTTVPLKLDLYRRAGDTVTRGPAIVWVHGGGFSGGDKTRSPFPALARKFARRGYVTASINYRLPASCETAALAGPARRAGGRALAARERGAVRRRPDADRDRRGLGRRHHGAARRRPQPRTRARAGRRA